MSEDAAATQTRIDAAEHEVMRADARLARTAAQMKSHACKLSSYSAPLAVAGGYVALRVLRRSFRRRKASGSVPGVRPARAGLTALLLRMGLPATMGFMRQQADNYGKPGRAMGKGLPLPRVSSALDRARFSGRWYEVSCLRPQDDTAASPLAGEEMSVTLVPDATGFDVEVATQYRGSGSSRRAAANPRRRVRHGRLRADDPVLHPAQLSITFAPAWLHWLPAVWGDYWVLEVGRNYGFALVGDRERTDLRVLSRTPTIDPTVYDQLMRTARADGYPVDRMTLRTGTAEGPALARPAQNPEPVPAQIHARR